MLLTQIAICFTLLLAPILQVPAKNHNMPMIVATDVLIDVGHGGMDGGAVNGHILEKDINLKIGQILYRHLTAKGIKVVINRTGDYALSEDNHWLKIRSRHLRDLAQRKEIANRLKPKLMVSLHVNVSSNPGKSGPLVLHQNNERSIALGDSLLRHLCPLFGITSLNGLSGHGKSFYILKHSQCPTVILEMGYISNESDRKMLTTTVGQNQIAAAISSSLEQYLLNNES
jgi:N-acetylmuramoyl-L-alanine amidase